MLIMKGLDRKAHGFVIGRHLGQIRKSNGLPYVAHLEEVANIITWMGGTAEEVASGYLHDVCEDQGVEYDFLEKEFGEAVAKTVAAVTEKKEDAHGKRSWTERKEESIAALLMSLDNRSVVLVKFADVLSNLRGLMHDGYKRPGIWELFNASRHDQLWYYRGCLRALSEPSWIPSGFLTEAHMVLQFIEENIPGKVRSLIRSRSRLNLLRNTEIRITAKDPLAVLCPRCGKSSRDWVLGTAEITGTGMRFPCICNCGGRFIIAPEEEKIGQGSL
jgi:hypothetical protein